MDKRLLRVPLRIPLDVPMGLRRWLIFCCGLLLTLLIGHPAHPLGTAAIAQQRPTQLVQDGVVAYRSGHYDQAIALWSQALQDYPANSRADQAVIHENLARTYQQIGETQAAINAWEAAAADYKAAEDTIHYGRMLTGQAQVYISLGLHQRAVAILCGEDPDLTTRGDSPVPCTGGAYAIAAAMNDTAGQAAALGSLAETYRLRGSYETAQTLLQQGLTLVRSDATLASYEAAMLNSFGTTYARLAQVKSRRAEAAALLNKMDIAATLRANAEADRQQAFVHLTQAIAVAVNRSDPMAELRSQLNLLSLSQTDPGFETVNASQQRLSELITELPAGRETAYAAIALAKSYRTAERDFVCTHYQENAATQRWLEISRQIAEQIGDSRSQSFALGELGHLAECQHNWPEATRLTNLAQLAANSALESADSLYLWEWQMGRIHTQQNQLDNALAAYKQAIATLESIRTNILTANRDLQFDFRDTVEPAYRQYIELQLAATPPGTKQVAGRQESVAETLQTIDALRLAELQNFFGDDCVLVASDSGRDRLLGSDPHTAVITSIVLPDRTALIANLPNGQSEVFWIDDSKQLEALADSFRSTLKRYADRVFDLSSAEMLYQQLLAPLEPSLAQAQVQTLVFVQDGFLRNIPMAALYDGNQYLIQKYAIATTPSLTLTASRSAQKELRALAVGLSEYVTTENGRRFPDLKSVPAELAAILQQLPGSKTLLNEQFTVESFKTALQEARYPILHIATHGQFSTVPEETFVITGPSASGTAKELTFSQLEALIHESSPNADPVELITLTACETATGDDRATLGLAGVAIQAGARSAIASLWRLDDATAATLIPSFYSNLQDLRLSKAQALQAAQIEAIEANPNANPGRWAPLILVGNWQ